MTLSREVATKETIEYRFRSRLPSAQRVQDKFILVAAIDNKRVRAQKAHKRRGRGLCSAESAEGCANHLQPVDYTLQPIAQMHRIEIDEQAELISRQT